jgi:hypothetical protein
MPYNPEHIMPGPYEHVADFTEAMMREDLPLWPQAAAELTGFARHLADRRASITARQIRMAVWLAERQVRATSRMTVADESLFDVRASFTDVAISVDTTRLVAVADRRGFLVSPGDARWYAARLVEAAEAADRRAAVKKGGE